MTDLQTAEVAVQRSWKIVIPTPGKWMTANDRGHWSKRAPLEAAWRSAAERAARQMRPKIPRGLDLVRVDVLLRYGRKPVREIENLRDTLKACVDGAVGPARVSKKGTSPGYGIVTDDSDKHVLYGAYDGELMELTKAQKVLNPYAGEVVLTVTELTRGDS